MRKNHLCGMIPAALLACMLIALASDVSNAQFMRMSAEDQAKILKDSLALDSVQTSKAVVILKEASDARTSAFQSSEGDREAMRAKMTDITKNADNKIKAILTETQKKKYEEIIKNRPAPGQRRRRG